MLFIVIGIIMVVVILTTVALRIVASHARLTHHQVSRIQAQYAARAGMVLALENLRTGVWEFAPPATNSCPYSAPCLVSDASFPAAVKSVNVVFLENGTRLNPDSPWCFPPVGSDLCVSSTADFAYP